MMSRFWLRRPDRCAALLVAWLGLQGLGLTNVSGSLDVVAVAPTVEERHVSLVADVQPAATRLDSESFSVTAGDVRLPTRAAPLLSKRSAIGVVVDGSNGATLRAGLAGAANLLSKIPATAQTAVVADGEPPSVIATPRPGATDALQALAHVRATGERATSDAVTLVLRQLSVTTGRPRVIVLHTTAAHAGRETADDLAARLTEAQAVLVVVTAHTDTWYWSRVAAATGGVVVAARPGSAATAFDDVVGALRMRYMLTFPAPGGLTAWVSVRVSTPNGTLTTETLVPGQDAIGHSVRRSGAQPNRSVERLWLVTLVGPLTAIGAATLLLAWRVRSRDARAPRVTPQPLGLVLRGPGRLSTSNEPQASTASKLYESGVHSHEISGRDPPAEIASYDKQAINDSTGDLDAETDSTTAFDIEKAGVFATGGECPPKRDATTVVGALTDSYPTAAGDNRGELQPTPTLNSPSRPASVAGAVTAAREQVQALTERARAAARRVS